MNDDGFSIEIRQRLLTRDVSLVLNHGLLSLLARWAMTLDQSTFSFFFLIRL